MYDSYLEKYYLAHIYRLSTKEFTNFDKYPDCVDENGKPKKDSYPEWAQRFLEYVPKTYPRLWKDVEDRYKNKELPKTALTRKERKESFEKLWEFI
jgi:protoporphyrinogen oxidase